MPTQTQNNEFYVPALMDKCKVLVSSFWLSRNIRYRRNEEQSVLSAAEYHKEMSLPTLSQLRYAFFEVSPDYKEIVISRRKYGEWTSTFLNNGDTVIENPNKLIFQNDIWRAEGGNVIAIKLPNNGWVTKYDKITGFPIETSQDKEDAQKVFGNYASYFSFNSKGMRAVLRDSDHEHGPFYVNALNKPNNRHSDIGGRECRRSN